MRIPIVYATSNDLKYMLITAVSAVSATIYLSDEDGIDFFILVNEDCPQKNKETLKDIVLRSSNKCSVTFLEEGIEKEDVYTSGDLITKETCYRLFLPNILSEYDKCIYLDSDTIVCSDIKKLYLMIPDDKYIIGVKAPDYHLKEDIDYAKQACLPDLNQYINAGVLGLNLQLMREDSVLKKIRELLKIKMKSADQDCLNAACYGKIGFIDFKYNVMTKYASWSLSDYKGLFDPLTIIEAWNNPGIIHYADKNKPWFNLNCPKSEMWWDICRKAGTFDYFYENLKDLFYIEAIYHQKRSKDNWIRTTRHYPCMKDVTDNTYVIYGAGNRARQVIRWLKKNSIIPQYAIVTDKKKNPSVIEGITVKGVDEIRRKNVGLTLIVAMMENKHASVLGFISGIYFSEIVFLSDDWIYSE